MRHPWKHRFLGIAVFIMLLPAGAVAGRPPPLEYITLHVGYAPRAFIGVNKNDAMAAHKVLTRTFGREHGYDIDAVIQAFDSNEDLITAIRNGDVHSVVMDAWTFLETDLHAQIEPLFLPAQSGYGPGEDYLLRVSKDAIYQDIEDLRGKHIILMENINCLMSRYWTRVLLGEKGFEQETDFFRQVQVETKPMKTLLPVFFGKADACVMTRPVYEILCELNPQLRQRLRIIATSAPLVGGIVCVCYQGWAKPWHRTDFIDAFAAMPESRQGRQVLTLFKTDHLVPFQEHFMAGTRALKARHNHFLRKREGKVTSAWAANSSYGQDKD